MKLNHLFKDIFDKYPLDHSFDTQQIDKFINKSDLKVRNICKKIFDYTEHISFEIFLIRLNYCIDDLFDYINFKRPIFIFIDISNDDYKLKSNYWIYTYFQKYVKYKFSDKLEIIVINDINHEKIKNNDIIIFLDDCIYSGFQMGTTFKNLNNHKNLNLLLALIVPYISYSGYINITHHAKNIMKKCDLFISKYVSQINHILNILTQEECNLINYFYSNDINPDYNFFDFENSYLIFFDHKIADLVSINNIFYFGVVPNKKNKKYINNIYKEIENYRLKHNINCYDIVYYFTNIFNFNSKLFDIIPIIKNCKNFNNNFDFMYPVCPYPPYKKDFLNFINIVKKNKVKYNSLPLEKKSNKKINKSL